MIRERKTWGWGVCKGRLSGKGFKNGADGWTREIFCTMRLRIDLGVTLNCILFLEIERI